jgi:tripartite motif-containing protein 71
MSGAAGVAGSRADGRTAPGTLHRVIRFDLEDVLPRPLTQENELRAPAGVSVDFTGQLYVSESGAGRVAVFSPAGTLLAPIGSPGTGERRFEVPAGVSASRSFSLLVADSEGDRIQIFDHMGNFAGWLPADEGELSRPWGIDLGDDGRLYIVDRDNHTVVVVNTSGDVVDRLGSLGAGGAQLRDPTFIAVNDARIVVADTGNRRLQLFDVNGSYAGEIPGGEMPGGFVTPSGVELGADGTVYVADATTATIAALDEHGHLYAAAGRGAGDPDGPVAPAGLALGTDDRLYVADREGGRVYIYHLRRDGSAAAPDAPVER